MKGRSPFLHQRVSGYYCIVPKSIFKPKIMLLWKLTWRPGESSNKIKVSLMFMRALCEGRQKSIVLSAYCKWEILDPFRDTSIPSHRLREVALNMSIFNYSTTRSNKKGERGPPWWSPRCNLNGWVGETFKKTEAEADITHDRIQSIHQRGKLIWDKIQSK